MLSAKDLRQEVFIQHFETSIDVVCACVLAWLFVWLVGCQRAWLPAGLVVCSVASGQTCVLGRLVASGQTCVLGCC